MQSQFLLGAYGTLIENNSILLVKRTLKTQFFPGCWTLPGGRLEDQDTNLSHTLIREFQEETGLKIVPVEQINDYHFDYLGNPLFGIVYSVKKESGVLAVDQDEIVEARWMTLEELQQEQNKVPHLDEAVQAAFAIQKKQSTLENERTYQFEPIDTITHFKDFIVQFNSQYKQFAAWKTKQLSQYNAVGDELAASLYRTFVADAKRVRPLFAYMTHRLLNLSYYGEDIIRLGVGLEYFHDFALIHDDITDLSDTRRGEPTIEAEFREKNLYRGAEVAKHIGLNAAMYAGDIALFQSTYIIDTLNIHHSRLSQIQDIFYEMQTEVALGQVDDGFGIRHDDWSKVSEERIKSILSLKSGRYSIQKPMLLGAALAGVDDKTFKFLEKIGEDFGIVFQVKDDLLGIFGEEEEMGKSATSDITEGKKTLIMYHTLNRADQAGKDLLLKTLGNPLASTEDINLLKDLVITTGVRDEMEAYCKQGAEEFKSALRSIHGVNPTVLELFEQLADYIVERRK